LRNIIHGRVATLIEKLHTLISAAQVYADSSRTSASGAAHTAARLAVYHHEANLARRF
jgi:hypothetical protein